MKKEKIRYTLAILISFFITEKTSFTTLTTEQQAVYDAVMNELKTNTKTLKIGNATIDGEKETIVFPSHLIQGYDATTKLDGRNHSLSLGLFRFDGEHGNIYLGAGLTSDFAANTVASSHTMYTQGIAGSNIALGSGNMAGISLIPIKKK